MESKKSEPRRPDASSEQNAGPDPAGTEEAEAGFGETDDDLESFAMEAPPSEDEAAPASVKAGAAAIRGHWKHAPKGPGVYRMIGADGSVLYVGKAKSVRKRIASYMRPAGHTNRIARMIALTVSMVFVSTATETEALLLETNYIKQMKPRFNVLMRDDKSFPYILLTGDHAAPQITKHRGARSRKGDYFGPFASVWAVNRTLNALERAFLLRSCSDSYYENRTRPCLPAPDQALLRPLHRRDQPRRLRRTRRRGARTSFPARAARCAICSPARWAQPRRPSNSSGRRGCATASPRSPPSRAPRASTPKVTEEADVFAVLEQAGQFLIEVFFFRTYQNWGNRAYHPKADRSLTSSEVLEAFLAQFYDERPPPRLVLISHEIEGRALLETALCERYGQKVEIAVAPARREA